MTDETLSQTGPFIWFIPFTSIATICIITFYTIPKQQYLGLFIVIWWGSSCIISLNNTFLSHPYQWSEGDWFGLLVLTGWPVLVLGTIMGMYKYNPSIRQCILNVPASTLIILQLNRLSGASVLYQYKVGGHLPKYIGIQTALLDILIAMTSVPLAWMVKNHGLHVTMVRNWAHIWHSIGLFDVLSAAMMRVMNYLHLGGKWIAQPSVTLLGFHPFALVILFQQTLAMGVHLFFIINTDQCLEANQKQFMRLPVSIRKGGIY